MASFAAGLFASLLVPQSPAADLYREARALERKAEDPETRLRPLGAKIAAIDAAVAKYREFRAAAGADEEDLETAVLAEEDLQWRAGEDFWSVDRLDEARARFEASIETCRASKTEPHSRIARSLASIARLELDRGNVAEAERQIALAESELARGQNEPRVGRRVHAVLGVRARTDFRTGLHDAAVLAAERAFRAALEVGMTGYAGTHAEALAEFLGYLGEGERAVAVLREALEACKPPARRASVAASLARAEEGAGRPAKSLPILDEEVEPFLASTGAFPHLAVRAAHFRVRALRAMGRFEEAESVLEETRGRFEAAEELGRSLWFALRASVAWDLGRTEETLSFGEEGLARYRRRGEEPPGALRRALGLARVAAGDREGGLELLRESLADSIRWVGRMRGTEDVASNLDLVVRSAEALLDGLLGAGGSGDPEVLEEAFRAVEVSKAEVLRRALVRRTAEEPPLDPDLESRRRDLFRSLSLLSARMVAAKDPASVESLRVERDVLERQAEGLEREFRVRHPRAGTVRGLEPVSLADLQASLAPGVCVLDYLVGERGVYVVVVRREGAWAGRVGAARDLRDSAAAARALLRTGAVDPETLLEQTRGWATEILARPLAGLGGEVRQILVLPDGPLHRLPFEALPSPFGAGFLVEDVAVGYGPSASALLALARGELGPEESAFLGVAVSEGIGEGVAPAGGPVARFAGLGPLPRAEEEVRRAAAVAGGERRLLLGREATLETFRALDLPRYEVLHFAAHGVPDEERPGRSGLLLHEAGGSGSFAVLEAREISSLPLGADLVVLSACRSGGGPLQPGEGVRSLARSFLEAGARSVLLTLWEVTDPACLAFMDLFYEAFRGGSTKAEALRRAKIECMRSTGSRAGLRSPATWASFVLVGESDGTVPLRGSLPGTLSETAILFAAAALAGVATFVLLRSRRGPALAVAG